MKIALYQFDSSKGIQSNKESIISAINQAAQEEASIIVFQECALCGYPFVEIPNVEAVNFDEIRIALNEIVSEIKKEKIYVALGTLRKEQENIYNSMMLFSSTGELVGCYDKTALWGWDRENYVAGTDDGVFEICGIKIGFRICFDVRFPELFRTLYKKDVKLCFVSFCDVSGAKNSDRFSLIEGHLRTRAVENVMTVASVNSVSGFQTAPTAIYDCSGRKTAHAAQNEEALLIYDYQIPEVDFGMAGRICVSNELIEREHSKGKTTKKGTMLPLEEA